MCQVKAECQSTDKPKGTRTNKEKKLTEEEKKQKETAEYLKDDEAKKELLQKQKNN